MDPEILRLQKTLYTSKNPTRRWLHCTRRDWIIDEIQGIGGERRSALEVGFGSGVYLPHLAARYAEVTGIDKEPAFLEHGAAMARDLPNLRVIADDITRSKLDANSFDLVLCSEVIEHIPDWPKAMAEMYRLLKSGGRLILSTPQPYSPV
ncbi:MAG TPA: class I SAM-dependent methyltransferase, partial [Candidatus Binataceae bacterium]|nr:class I SAM-dependent methyltransferase [Candidatus Binataceae bacterium]